MMEIDRSPQSLSVSNEGVSKVVDQFSITLKKFDNEKLDNLYNHESTKDVQKCKYEYTDVISSVVSAVKRMQNSHDIKNCKDNTVLKEFKRSTFWPVGAIPNENMHNNNTVCMNNIQQCGPETQNMIEVAQMLTQMLPHHGVTQEFNTSFFPETNKINNQEENLIDTKIITVQNNIEYESHKCKDRLLCNCDDVKFSSEMSIKNDVSSVLAVNVGNKSTYDQFVESTNSDIIICQNQINAIKENNNEYTSCQTLPYSNCNKLLDVELLPTQILPKKGNRFTNVQVLPYLNNDTFIDDMEFLPTQLLPKQDNEYSESQTLSHSNDIKLLEDMEFLPTQILPKKENSTDSKQTTLTCDKMTESIDSDVIVNSNKSPHRLIDIIPKSPILKPKKSLIKLNTLKSVKEEVLEKSTALYNNVNKISSPIVINEDISQKVESNAFALNQDSNTDIQSDNQLLNISSNTVGIVSDFNAFGKFEEIASPIVHKYTNCEKAELKQKIVSEMEKKSALVLENEDLLTTSGWGSIPFQCFYGGATRSEYKSHLDNVLMESNKECFPAEENGHKKCEIKEESDFDYEIIRSDEESDYVKGNTYSSESTRENPEIIHKVAFTESKIETTNDKIVSSNDSSKAKANIYEVVQRAESLKSDAVGENGFHDSSEFHYLPLDTSLDLISVVNKITETDNFGADKGIKHEHSKAEKDFEINKISFKEGNQVQNSALNDTFKADSNAESKICDRFSNQHMVDCVECKEIDIFDDMFETDNFPTTEIINFANDEEFQDNVLPCFIDNQKFNENLIEVRDFQTNDEDPFDDDKLLKTSFQPVIDIIKRDDNVSEEKNKKVLNNVFKNIESSGSKLKIKNFTHEEDNETQCGHTNNDSSLQVNSHCVNFTTSSSKNIAISDKASELVEGWVVVNSNIHIESENLTLDSDLKLPKVGYSNADNEKVKLIDEHFKSPVDRLPPLSSEETQDLTDTAMCPNLGEVPGYVGCPTASNKKIKVTEMSLQNTIANLNFDQNDKCIFLDMKQKPIDKTGSAEKNVMSSNHTTPFIGFHTASNKKVEISENALKRINKELSNCAVGLNYLMEPIENVKNSKKKEDVNAMKLLEAGKQNPVVIGFQTASKKKIEVSKEALQKIKKVIEGWDYEQGGQEKMLDINLLPKNKEKFVEQVEMNKEIPMFVGFSTASNKRVEVSEDALAKIKSTGNVDANMSIRSTDLVNLINTQASMNFNEADCTKVFQKNVPPDQRSASPILQCRNPKRRKISEAWDSSIPKNLNTDLQNLINTQVTNDFNETVHTEEFHNDPSSIPRSTSPVLQCSSAKRRKIFRTPISRKVKTDKAVTKSEENKCFPEFVYKYKTDYKKLKRNSLSNLQTKNENKLQLNVHIDLENIMNSEFDNTRNSLTGRKIDMLELKRIFMHSPDINRRIIPEGWFENHIKHIAWKLISYELKYSDMENIYNVENVLDQLKYRYDRELYNCERPALRKILEKDETSTRTIVLCVMKIFSDGPMTSSSNANVELELTDGWYTIKATIDDLLKRMVSVGRIRIGTKIITQGAELVNCDQGVAPWEDTTNVRLKIYGNSTRRVRWHTRLGFHGNSAILVPLSSVKLGGGKVSKIKVFVARVYPLLYMEKFEDGSTVTRSERLEHLYEAKCEVERQIMLEKIYDEVEKEFDGKSSTDSEEICVYGSGCRNTLDTGSQIVKCLKKCKDPLEFQANLSESQSDLLKQHTLKRQEKKLKEFQDKIQEKIENSNLKMHRNVMAVLKVRIVDIKLKDGQCVETTKGLLSIWNVNENVTEIFKEGTWMEASNVLPTGVRAGEIKISANRHSMFNKITVKDEQKYRLYMEELSRICVPISQIAKYPYKKYEFSEIDTVGLVFAVEPTMLEFRKQKNQYLQNVYITDEKRNFICVNFWGGLQKYGLENLIDTGQIVICMNLQKRYGSTVGSIPQFRVTEFSCFTRTPKGSKSRMLYDELKGKLNSINISMFCEECLKLKSVNTRRDNNENIFPYKSNNAQYAFNRGNYVNASLTADKSVDIIKLDLSDIDFESTFKDVNMDDLSPSERLRKKRLNEKLSKLRMYDEPPKLSPIYIINTSSKANSSYISPLLENVGICKDVSYDNSKNANSRISVNNIVTPKNVKFKSNINRSAVNPIKLDFSANVASGKNVNVDMFSEEFDPSPPLSLDSQSF